MSLPCSWAWESLAVVQTWMDSSSGLLHQKPHRLLTSPKITQNNCFCVLLFSSGESGRKWSDFSQSSFAFIIFFPSNKWVFMTVCKYLLYWPSEALHHFLHNGLCGLVVCNTNSGNICVLGYIFAYFFMANVGSFRFFYIRLGMSIIS